MGIALVDALPSISNLLYVPRRLGVLNSGSNASSDSDPSQTELECTLPPSELLGRTPNGVLVPLIDVLLTGRGGGMLSLEWSVLLAGLGT